jgi:hypothetical protein
METIMDAPRLTDSQAEDFAQARISLEWISAKVFELQLARKAFGPDSPPEIDDAIDLLLAEGSRLTALASALVD